MQLLPSIVVRRRVASNDAAIRLMSCRAAALLLSVAVLFVGCTEQASDSQSDVEQLEEVARQKDEQPDERVQVLDDDRSVSGRINDARIAAQVRLALVDADELRLFDFDPVVLNGRVLLRGEVQTQAQRRRAESVAGSVEGVREVVNEISATEEPVVAEAEEDSTQAPDTSVADRQRSAESEDVAQQGEEDAAPEVETKQPEPAPQPEETFHTVKSGESLWTISRQYGVTIDQIRRLNNLRSNSLRPGQRLRVK